jgi:molecular chaperone GrpE (heat shock protein)
MDNCVERGVCAEHSGICVNITNISKEMDNLKKELHEQKGYNTGMFSLANRDIQDVNQKLRDEMKEMKKEIQAEMKTQLDDIRLDLKTGLDDIKTTISTNNTKKENKFNAYLTAGILPTIVAIIIFTIEHYFGK